MLEGTAGALTTRWSYAHGGYIAYDYRCKGDRFTRGEAPSPYVYATGRRADGTPYRRRLRTTEVLGVQVREVLGELLKAGKGKHERLGEVLAGVTCYLDPHARRLEVRLEGDNRPPPEGWPIGFSSSPQRLGGTRWWWSCPRCDRRCSTVYAVKATRGTGAWTGCRECLGLTYASRSLHKSQAMDRRTMERGLRGGSVGAWERAANRERRRLEAMVSQLERLGAGMSR